VEEMHFQSCSFLFSGVSDAVRLLQIVMCLERSGIWAQLGVFQENPFLPENSNPK